MAKERILVLNPVAQDAVRMLEGKGYILDNKPGLGKEEVQGIINGYDAVIVRSYKMNGLDIRGDVKAIARAGSGTNNIPVADMTGKGIVVFNAPGANANAVAEQAIACMIMAARNIPEAIEWTKAQDHPTIEAVVEKGKSRFNGSEIAGKTLAVLGLGAIGSKVATLGYHLGMDVRGYDPQLSAMNALQMDPHVRYVPTLEEAVAGAAYVSVHVPYNEATAGLVGKKEISLMEKGVVLMNLARGGIVNRKDLVECLKEGKVRKYVSDFPHPDIMGYENIILLPHLGASTEEAENNCAMMVARQLDDYLTRGNIENSVNLPGVSLVRNCGPRVCVVHKDVPGAIGQITTTIGRNSLNISRMANSRRGEVGYTIADLDMPEGGYRPSALHSDLTASKDIIKVRII